MGTRKRLSSRISTIHWSLIAIALFPPVLILTKAFAPSSLTWWFMLASFVLGMTFGCLIQRKIKRVELTNDSLNIRDSFGSRSEVVPLTEIDEVRQLCINGYVSIRFRTPNRFGDRILFIPRIRLVPSLFRHPDLIDLEQKVRDARL